MFDELDLLRNDAHLRELLSHYARLGAANRETWQDRLMQMEGTEPRDLVQLHGALIAFDWIEQNTGASPGGTNGAVPACYRITTAGESALRQVQGSTYVESEVVPSEPPAKSPPRFPRKKREASKPPGTPALAVSN